VARYLVVPTAKDKSYVIRKWTATEIAHYLQETSKMNFKVRTVLLGKVLAKEGFKRKGLKVGNKTRYIWIVKPADIYTNAAEDEDNPPEEDAF
jgi:hypothetical protein